MDFTQKLLITVCIILGLAYTGNTVSCYGCLPSLKGGRTSRDLAVMWRSNLSRTYPGRSEDEFGLCDKMTDDIIFQAICPTNDRLTVCMWANNGYWFVRTCGRIGNDEEPGCKNVTMAAPGTEGHITGTFELCKCFGDFCNAGDKTVYSTFNMILAIFFVTFIDYFLVN